jgi:hypothetical protein
VPLDQRKALSAFSFGSSGFLLAPEMSQQILSCLEEKRHCRVRPVT